MSAPGDYDLDVGTARVQASLARFTDESAAVDLAGAHLDVAYGPDPRQAYDVFPAGPGAAAAAMVHWHGGYWRAGTKEARRFPAPAWQARGAAWISVEYRLCPEAGLADLVADARAALAHVAAHASEYGIDPARLHLSGHSAGAHLAAMAARDGPAASLTVTSGLFDLAPLRREAAQDWLRLSAAEAEALSPLRHLPPPALPVTVAWGAEETAAFAEQSKGFAATCRAQGSAVTAFARAGADHFEAVADYGDPESRLFQAMAAQM